MPEDRDQVAVTAPSAPTADNICAVVVTYHPDGGLDQRLARIARQIPKIVVVDNHSGETEVTWLRQLESRHRFDLILNEDNLGIAAALNQGVARVVDEDIKWVLLLDQDSEILDDIVEVLRLVYESVEDKCQIGVIGGNYINKTTGMKRYRIDSLNKFKEKTVAITSGSLIPLRTFSSIGNFMEDLFIDHVDHEFCLRARSERLKIFISEQPIIKHSIGPSFQTKFLGKNIETTNHSALRRYYMTRNLIFLIKNYWKREPEWLFRMVKIQFILYLIMLAAEEQRLEKLMMIFLGLWHGVRGKSGRYMPDAAA